MEKKVRGASIIGMLKYIEQMDDESKATVWRQVPEDLAEPIKKVEPTGFYPMEYTNVLQRGIASTYSDPNEAYRGFVKLGRTIADEALNTFLRLLIRFLSPAMFARKFGDFFRRDHTFGDFESDLSGIDDRHFVLHMSGVEGYEYVAPTASGWMLHTLEAMGCKNVEVRETLSPPPGPQDVDRYRFEISWN